MRRNTQDRLRLRERFSERNPGVGVFVLLNGIHGRAMAKKQSGHARQDIHLEFFQDRIILY
ncbi:hypothetical protein SDC9_202786 [bioreactor metagenome]|uniref:Uncharacterized protein n=1 Tax=bioreactor metagenome TaxID=1076179 RepID=A0A645IVD8_9ZZZZ